MISMAQQTPSSDALLEEFVDRVLSSPFVDDELYSAALGDSKHSLKAAHRYFHYPIHARPDISYYFDRRYYTAKYQDVADADGDPFVHFMLWGCGEARSPHPLIDPGFIKLLDPFLLPDGCSDRQLFEVLRYDLADPSPYFSLEFYRTEISESSPHVEGLLGHFLTKGLVQGLRPHALFDPTWYHKTEGLDDPATGIRHFVLWGDREGRAASPHFSGRRYFARYPDVAEAGFAALRHFLTEGKSEGRFGLAEQDAPRISVALDARKMAATSQIDDAVASRLYDSLKDGIREIRQAQKESVTVRRAEILHFKDPIIALRKLALPRAKRPKVSILVPIYNELRYTAECVGSIIASQPKADYQVIIADDASTDPTVKELRKIKNIRLLTQPANVGFLANCNAAYRACESDYVLLLNNDAQLMPNALDELVAVLDTHRDVAAVGPKILYPDGRLQEAGCAIDRDGVSTMVGLFADPTEHGFGYDRDVHYCSGAALLVRRCDVGDVLFDEAFRPAYCEDTDLCLRLLSKGMRIVYCARAQVVHHLSVSTNKQSVTKKLQLIARNQQKLASKWQELLEGMNSLRVIAFYLPQFHPTPENDFHWGQGFTEWTNVARATPGYVGHYQPHLPADLGFYDLRIRQTIERQAALARRYGVAGFCVYYYNFGSRRALDQAFEAIVADQTIDFPFCICWANENWTRHWDGGTREIIFEQQYDPTELQNVINDAVRYAADPRYLRVNGMPLLLVYRPLLIPELEGVR